MIEVAKVRCPCGVVRHNRQRASPDNVALLAYMDGVSEIFSQNIIKQIVEKRIWWWREPDRD